MRSAEESGVSAKGFGLSGPRVGAGRGLQALLHASLRCLAGISPVTLAVGVTALFAATLFVIVDTVRTHEDHRLHQTLAAHVSALSFEPIAAADEAGGPDGLLQRGAGAFGLALLVTALVWRRRGRPARNETGLIEDVLGTIPFGIAFWSQAGRLVLCNEQYRSRLGAGPESCPGASYIAALQRLLQGGDPQIVAEDDSGRLLEITGAGDTCLLIDERPLAGGGFVTLVTDVTERRRTDRLLASIREEQRLLARRYHEEKLRAEAASRSKTSFLAHLSHDIRTPLNHIIGFADLMQQQTYGPLGDPHYLGYVEAVKSSGERLLALFASILELAELESGQKPLKAELFAVDELLVATARRFQSQAQRAGLTLRVGAVSGARMLGDRFSLERMLSNIVENALRFTPHGGKVTVSAFAATDGVVLEITDTGIGMSEQQLAMLSQPFAFGDAGLARGHGGAGLGIAIARAIAELSGGRLAIDSRMALGTTVAISLPAQGMEQAEAA